MNEECDGVPPRLDVRGVPGLLARSYADSAVRLLGLPLLVEVDRAVAPMVPVGELLADRLAACAVPDLEATVLVRHPGLRGAVESDPCVIDVLALVEEWADWLLASAMTAARITGARGGDGRVVAA